MPQHILSGDDSPRARDVEIETRAPTVVVVDESGFPVLLDEHSAHVIEATPDNPVIVHVIEPVILDPTLVGSSLSIDDLTDVDAPASTVGLLERQDDGDVRPVTRAAVLAPHVNSPTPHPVYDDSLDLTLLFNNGLV